ncbi:MAG: hypothetical protein ACOC1F_14145, partial [Myxococcota bacterium]
LKRFGPPAVNGIAWAPDEGTQPPPQWAPAVYRGELKLGPGTVDVRAFSPKRTGFRLRAGSSGGHPDELSRLGPTLAGRVLGALVTGGADNHLALRVSGHALGTPSSGARLYVDTTERLRVVGPSQHGSIPEDADWMELPLLAAGAKVAPDTRDVGDSRFRTAVCSTQDGTVWLARAQARSYAPLVETLQRAGCEVVASLDRGTERPSKLYRVGTGDAPVDRYDVPVVYVLGAPLAPGAFRWRSDVQ